MPNPLAFAATASLALATVTISAALVFAADLPRTPPPVQPVQPQVQAQVVAPAPVQQPPRYAYYGSNTVLYGTAGNAHGYYFRPPQSGWYAYNNRAWLSTTVVGSAVGPSFTEAPEPAVPPLVVTPQPVPPTLVFAPAPIAPVVSLAPPATAAPAPAAPPPDVPVVWNGRTPRGAPVTHGGIEPGTQAWVDYCTSKYKSFNPNTGKYYGYDNAYHFCR